MGSDVKKFYDPDGGCTYFYDEERQCYMKVCMVGSYTKLPPVIKQQILAAQEEAKHTLALPVK